ncbi:MAG: hypothetical protein AAF244_01560 [Pseudomonadota bacterium]
MPKTTSLAPALVLTSGLLTGAFSLNAHAHDQDNEASFLDRFDSEIVLNSEMDQFDGSHATATCIVTELEIDIDQLDSPFSGRITYEDFNFDNDSPNRLAWNGGIRELYVEYYDPGDPVAIKIGRLGTQDLGFAQTSRSLPRPTFDPLEDQLPNLEGINVRTAPGLLSKGRWSLSLSATAGAVFGSRNELTVARATNFIFDRMNVAPYLRHHALNSLNTAFDRAHESREALFSDLSSADIQSARSDINALREVLSTLDSQQISQSGLDQVKNTEFLGAQITDQRILAALNSLPIADIDVSADITSALSSLDQDLAALEANSITQQEFESRLAQHNQNLDGLLSDARTQIVESINALSDQNIQQPLHEFLIENGADIPGFNQVIPGEYLGGAVAEIARFGDGIDNFLLSDTVWVYYNDQARSSSASYLFETRLERVRDYGGTSVMLQGGVIRHGNLGSVDQRHLSLSVRDIHRYSDNIEGAATLNAVIFENYLNFEDLEYGLTTFDYRVNWRFAEDYTLSPSVGVTLDEYLGAASYGELKLSKRFNWGEAYVSAAEFDSRNIYKRQLNQLDFHGDRIFVTAAGIRVEF